MTSVERPEDDDVLDYGGAERLTSIKRATLYALVSERRIPHIRIGRRFVRFSKRELLAWLQQHRVLPRSDT